MEVTKTDTQQRILAAGKTEFMNMGFQDASLRHIAQLAGVTTGAIYGYYTDKATLFSALVEPAAGEFQSMFQNVQQEFAALPAREQINQMNQTTTSALQMLLDYVYSHYEAFRLLISKAAGTPYENYIDSLVDIEVDATLAFARILRQEGYRVAPLSGNLIHILSRAYFTAIFETVDHQMPKDEADTYVSQIASFFWAGWHALLPLR